MFLIIILLSNTHQYFLTENKLVWQLKNNYIEVQISKTTGNIIAIYAKDENLISNPCIMDFNIKSNEDLGRIIKTKVIHPSTLYFKKDYCDKTVEYQYILDSLSLRWEASTISKSYIKKDLNIDYLIPIVKNMEYMFYPDNEQPISLKDFQAKTIRYRRNFALPIITFYNHQNDYGISIIGAFENSKPDLLFCIDKEKLVVSYKHLRFPSKNRVKVSIYIIPHSGHWREELSFLLTKYPEYFFPKVENTKSGEGLYYLGSPFDNEDKIKRMNNYNVKWLELHGHFPFYGLYAPPIKEWGLVSNSDEIILAQWEKSVVKKRNSYKNIRDLVSLWHKYGIQVYLYFQAFEAWHQYAEKYFVDDIARDRNGNPLPAWKFCNLMNPDPKGKWGKYIINQAKEILKKYPQIDGIFYDRMDYWNYDFAHNDGRTMIDGKSVYMLGFALEKIDEKIFDMFHKKGKAIWGNGPTSIEVCKNLDGIMAEGSLRNLYRLQYLCLVRPLIYLPYDKTPKETEEKLKHSLVCGAFPSITYGGEECQKLDEKYRPLFELIKNRKWVLTSNPIEVPERFRANIFQTADSNYVAVIISPEKSQLVPHPFEYNIPVTVNLPDAQEIKNAYLLSGDWNGVVGLSFKEDGNKINISIPAHLSSSLIYLSKKEKFKNALTTIPVLIEEPISFVPTEDIFIQSMTGDLVKFYFTNNTHQKLIFELQAVFIKGDGWAKPPKKIILNSYETKIMPLIIGAKGNGEIKLKVLFNNKSIEKIFSLKASLVHEDDDLFYDDFKEEMKKWTVNRGKWDVLNGIAQGSGPSHFALIKNNNWQDYMFEVKTRIKGSDDPSVDWLKSYIFFRLQDEKNFYRFGIHGDAGVIDLYKCVDGKWILLAKSLFEPELEKWYALRIEAKGTKFAGYINGEKIIEANDNTFASGGIGIGVLEDGMRCEYKDIVVK